MCHEWPCLFIPLPSFLSLWWLKLPCSRVHLCHAPTGSRLRLCSFKGSGQTLSIQSWKVIPIFPNIHGNEILISQKVCFPAASYWSAFAPSIKSSILQTLLYNFTNGSPLRLPLRPLYTLIFFEVICNCAW